MTFLKANRGINGYGCLANLLFSDFSGNVFSEEVVKSHKIFFNPTELKLKDISNERKTKEMTIEMTD